MLRQADFSQIKDEDLTPEQREELQRRFHAFTRALAKAKATGPASRQKNIAKWTPKQARPASG
ncbi:MAG: hypothetical protein WCF16_07125 [Alphaproteobacteria bacterium]